MQRSTSKGAGETTEFRNRPTHAHWGKDDVLMKMMITFPHIKIDLKMTTGRNI